MNLYRIILVDDEEEVRKSIIKKIDWAKAGFEVVGDAENGEDALEKVEALDPDVVLTDIKMPYMDGLTLAERLKTKFPSIKILIFSGFDEFEYAQRAIQLMVTEYILKPVNVEELTAILNKVKKNLDEEIEQKRNVSLLRESYRKNLPIIREHFLHELLHGNEEKGNLAAKLKEYEIHIDGAEKWLAAVVHVEAERQEDKTLSFHKEQELIPISVAGMIEDKLKNHYRFALSRSASELVIIAAIDQNNSQTDLTSLLADICKETKKILEVTITIGIGNSCSDLKDLNRSYQSAMNALGYRAVVGAGSIIYIHDVEPVTNGKLKFDSKTETDLIDAIKFGPREKIDQRIRELIEKMDEARVHFRQQQAYMLGVISSVIQLVQQYDLEITSMIDSDMDYADLLKQIQKRDSFQNWLVETSYYINEAFSKERDNTAKNVIKEAKQYILDHYQDPELSVEKICRHLHMSPAYFSTVFKKETGQAYIGYLTEVRLNRAVELLRNTDDKTYIIAAKVGYPEQNYFSYVFKKQFGISPTKYRGSGK